MVDRPRRQLVPLVRWLAVDRQPVLGVLIFALAQVVHHFLYNRAPSYRRHPLSARTRKWLAFGFCKTDSFFRRSLEVRLGPTESIQSFGEPLGIDEAGFFTRRLPFLSPNQQMSQYTERTYTENQRFKKVGKLFIRTQLTTKFIRFTWFGRLTVCWQRMSIWQTITVTPRRTRWNGTIRLYSTTKQENLHIVMRNSTC